MPSELASSRYNFRIPAPDGVVLYNSCSGAAIRVKGADAIAMAELLSGRRLLVSRDCFEPAMLARLRRGGFLLDPKADELEIVRDRYWRARGETPIVLTLTTTQDCNLGCYYCYESRSKHRLTGNDIPRIVGLARKRLADSGKSSLHVDWYGGEPLMNIDFLERASAALQSLCQDLGIRYAASVISNGTCWPDDVGAFITLHRMRQVQISFDGLKANHDKRRRYRRGYAPTTNGSSFEAAAALVDRLLEHVQVDLRLNIDRGNARDIVPFLRFCEARGWFDAEHRLVFQLARLSSYSERSDFMRKSELSIEDFEALRSLVRGQIRSPDLVDEGTSLDSYPHPKTSVCAALATDSVVIGAEGHEYRCGLQVGESSRATLLRSFDGTMMPGNDAEWWRQFDPTGLPKCSGCSFLPVCWGGCPKEHLERDDHALDEQSQYWCRALPQKIAHRFGFEIPNDFVFSDRDQFRE